MKTTRIIAIAATLMAGWALVPRVHAASGDSADVNKLLADINDEAIQFQSDAQKISSFSRSSISSQTYATNLDRIRQHINEAGKTLADLNAQRENGSAWQQVAIDRINPLFRELTADTETLIGNFNKNAARIHTREFQDYVQAEADVAGDLTQVIGDFIAYGDAKTKMEQLADKLEIPQP